MTDRSPRALLQIALALRARLPDVADGSTTAWRLADGATDGLPGVEIDNFDGHWVAQTREGPLPPGLEEAAGEMAKSLWWKRLDQKDKRPPECLAGDAPPGPFPVRELGLNYEVDLRSGYSQGLFMDQRPQRARMATLVRQGDRVLNLFAYTCAFSVLAASRGAVTTSVDLSRPYLEWGRRNFALNGLDPEGHHFTRGDSFDWLKRFAKKGLSWNGIVVDPPTFSRNEKGEIFRAERDFPSLIAACLEVLAPGGWILASTNHRGITPRDFSSFMRDGAALAGRQPLSETPGSMPPDFTGPRYLKAVWITA